MEPTSRKRARSSLHVSCAVYAAVLCAASLLAGASAQEEKLGTVIGIGERESEVHGSKEA